MTATAQIHFVWGGKILDRTMPTILTDPTPSLVHRNRVLSQSQWDAFCDDIEAAMSWNRHWFYCFKPRAVQVSLSLTVASLLVLALTSLLSTRREEYYPVSPALQEMNDINADTTTLTDNLRSTTVLLQYILPDVCVVLAFVTSVTMIFSVIFVVDTLKDQVAQVCRDYTQEYQSYYGIRFAVKRHIVQVTTTRRPGHHGYAAAPVHRTKVMPYIEITQQPPEEVSITVRTAESHYQSMGAAPFFDLTKNSLLRNATPVRVPRMCKEVDEEQATTSAPLPS
jgi:hypothetical protein